MTRLCVLTVFAERLGGSDNVLWTFLRHLDRERFDPRVVFLGSGSFEREVAGLGIETRALPAGRLRNPLHVAATTGRIARLLRGDQPDLLLNWLSTAQLYGGPAAAFAGIADHTVWWQHDLHPRGWNRGHALDRLAALAPAVAVGACSQAAANLQGSIRPRRPAFAVLPGIDEPMVSDDPETVRERLAIPSDRVVVGVVGRLVAWKGHESVLRALAVLRAEGDEVHGLFVGGGGHRADERYEAVLRAGVERLGLADHVTFTGQVPDATDHIHALDVLVSSSGAEPFGLVLLEAMALGVPVLAVGNGGPAEIVEDGRTGVLVKSNSPDDLANGLREILASPERRSSLAAEGRRRWEERFTGERMTREMEAHLEELAA